MRHVFTLNRSFALVLPLFLLLVHCGDETSSTTEGSGGTGGATGGAGGAGGSGGMGGMAQGGGGSGGSASALPDLDSNLPWYGDNRAMIDAMIDEHGMNGAGYDAQNKPVAIFDWDNTVIKNDIGDATTFWMLKHDKVLQPPGKDWGLSNHYLSAGAKGGVSTEC